MLIKLFLFLSPIIAVAILLTHELFALLMPFLFIARFLNTKSLKLKNYYYEITISMLSVIAILSLYLLSNPNTVETCKAILSYGYDGIICLSINDLNTIKGKGFPIAHFMDVQF